MVRPAAWSYGSGVWSDREISCKSPTVGRTHVVLLTLRTTSASSVPGLRDKLDTPNIDRSDIDARSTLDAGVSLYFLDGGSSGARGSSGATTAVRHASISSATTVGPRTWSDSCTATTAVHRTEAAAVVRRRRFIARKQLLCCNDGGTLDANDKSSLTAACRLT